MVLLQPAEYQKDSGVNLVLKTDLNFDDLIGIPFVDGGRGPKGYDCWGCAQEVFKRYGTSLPDYPVSAMDAKLIADKITEEQQKEFWKEIKEPMAPCLVVFKLSCNSWANHVGVYIGDGQFIHAYIHSGIVIDQLKKWKNYIVGYYLPGGDCVD